MDFTCIFAALPCPPALALADLLHANQVIVTDGRAAVAALPAYDRYQGVLTAAGD